MGYEPDEQAIETYTVLNTDGETKEIIINYVLKAEIVTTGF